MHARLILHLGVHLAAVDLKHNLLIAAHVAGAFGVDLDLPALTLGVAGVGAVELSRKQGRFVATGPGPDLHNHVLAIVEVTRHQSQPQPLLDLEKGSLYHRPFGGGQVGQFRVVEGFEVLLQLAAAIVQQNQRL